MTSEEFKHLKQISDEIESVLKMSNDSLTQGVNYLDIFALHSQALLQIRAYINGALSECLGNFSKGDNHG